MTDNKLLAEFMGKEWHNSFFAGVSIISQSNITYKFDTDWNWLMQVVEKIESLGYCLIIGGRTTKNYCEIRGKADDFTTKYSDSYGETKIEAVYNACVEFIKWYNEQNK